MKNYIYKADKWFNLAQTLDCGQAFRWKQCSDNTFEGIAGNKYLKVSQDKHEITFYNTTKEEFELLWKKYFDFDRDYNEILDRARQDKLLLKITDFCGGIRVCNQDPWETLCSFIISQNNNIPRIKGIIERLCEKFGEPVYGGYAFPKAEKIAACSLDDLADLRCGFRAKYILDAAEKCTGQIDLEMLKKADIDKARETLMEIKGVGSKVADCTLLFGLGFKNAFPADVWIKRAMASLFKDGLPANLADCAGIIQQYIFYYARTEKIF